MAEEKKTTLFQQEQDLIVINKKTWEAQEQFRKNKDFGKPLQQEQSSEDLEEAAEKQVNEALFKWSYDDEDGIEQYVYDSFIAGAEWHREQMLKDAVEGKVVELGGTYKDLTISVEGKELNEALQPLGVKDGDRVRVMIVKEDKI